MLEQKQAELKIVLGLGKTGLSCVRFLTAQGIPVAVMDTREEPPGLAELRQNYPQVPIKLGGLEGDFLSRATEIILSPGLSLENPIIKAQQKRGIPVFGDIELFARLAKAPQCVITGSNAKSTVTTLVGEMAHEAGIAARVGGNIGTPALDLLRLVEPEMYVLELSSFQLETTDSLKPRAAAILNISPDHMDRYNSFEEYCAAKHRIYRNSNFTIFNRDDAATKPLDSGTQITFGLDAPTAGNFGLLNTSSGTYLAYGDEPLISTRELGVKGAHNVSNALAALALGWAMNLPMPAMLQTLQSFKGLPHRCQLVANYQGVQWYNDSKGTNVGASLAALEGLGSEVPEKIILIAGGIGKEADFSPLKAAVKKFVRTCILIGQDADLIAEVLTGDCEILFANSMENAVHFAKEKAVFGDYVLLSPACASFDMFNNFEHRGEVFMAAVRELLA